ncbi:MAG: hypothetical protein ACKODH_01150 [Limisphaerales bacterium]
MSAPATETGNPPLAEPVQPPTHPDDQNVRPRPGMAGKGPIMPNQSASPLLPFPPPGEKDFNPLKDAPLFNMMAEADLYAKEHPDELIGIVDRYRQIARKAQGTRMGAEAQRKSDNALLLHELKSHDLIEKLELQMQALVKQGKNQEAFEVWLAFPEGWRNRETDGQMIEIIRRLLPSSFRPQKPVKQPPLPPAQKK